MLQLTILSFGPPQARARDRMVSATCSALVNGKSAAVSTPPASPARSLTSPASQVVSAPSGKAARKAPALAMGKEAPASAATIWLLSSLLDVHIVPPELAGSRCAHLPRDAI